MTKTPISIETLRTKLALAFTNIGAPADEARVAAEVCLEAELLGRETHGVRLIGNVRLEYVNGADRRRALTIERETPVSAVVDGGFHLSLYVHDLAARLARTKASDSGIAIVGVKNAGVSGALGVHAAAISGNDLVALAFNSSPSVVVPPGTASPLLGSNPVSIAVPREGSAPVVLDMATAAMAFNAVRIAIQQGGELPGGVAVDADGHETTDPQLAVDRLGRGRLLPFGGHRGYGLALMIELLVAASLGEDIGERKIGPVLAEPSHFPGLYIAYRPDLLDEPGQLAKRAESLMREVSYCGGHVPGEDRARRKAAALEAGSVPVEDAYLDLLETNGEK